MRLLKCLSIFLFLFVGCKIKITYPSEFYEAKSLFEQKKFEKVIDLLENSKIKRSQKTDWYYYYYGVSLYEKSKRYTREAIENLDIAITFSKDVPDYYLYIGKMYFDIAEYEKARENFSKASQLCKKNEPLDNKKVNLWLALLLCKLGEFDYDDFKSKYSINESAYLEEFCKLYSEKKVSEDYIKRLFGTDGLELYEKLLIIDILFCQSSEKELCKKIIESCLHGNIDFDDVVRKFFYSKLLFYSLGDTEKCKEVLRQFCVEMINDVYVLDCNDFYVLEKFNKYLCFYYLLNEDCKNAINTLNAYKFCRYKILKSRQLSSEDAHLILEDFKADREFESLMFEK